MGCYTRSCSLVSGHVFPGFSPSPILKLNLPSTHALVWDALCNLSNVHGRVVGLHAHVLLLRKCSGDLLLITRCVCVIFSMTLSRSAHGQKHARVLDRVFLYWWFRHRFTPDLLPLPLVVLLLTCDKKWTTKHQLSLKTKLNRVD